MLEVSILVFTSIILVVTLDKMVHVKSESKTNALYYSQEVEVNKFWLRTNYEPIQKTGNSFTGVYQRKDKLHTKFEDSFV
jgi:hypothetical protein